MDKVKKLIPKTKKARGRAGTREEQIPIVSHPISPYTSPIDAQDHRNMSGDITKAFDPSD